MKKSSSKNRFVFLNDSSFIAEEEIDFHLLGKLDPVDIEVHLTEFIEMARAFKKTRLLIITGKGRVVKPVVKRLLKNDKRVRSFKEAGYYNGQGGAYEVELF